MKSDSDFDVRSDESPEPDDTCAHESEERKDTDSESSKKVALERRYLPGERIGRYLVVKELGSGGFGHVVLAEDETLMRKVAIKYPRHDHLPTHLKAFLEEGRSVARLDHPSIIKLYNIEETDDGLPFAVMEYIDGITLQQVIKSDGLTFTNGLKFMLQIARALEYAHSQTLIHRDLKPTNVIISHDGETAKLMDFGLAMHDLTPEESLTRNPEGTPAYMAPEQVRGENHRLDGRTDIWGFGVIMYIMLTGQRPFRGKRVREVLTEICLDDPIQPQRVNRDVPAELNRICLNCLEKLMSSRYQSASELVEDLEAFESGWHSSIQELPSIDTTGIHPSSELSSRAYDSTGRSSDTHSLVGQSQQVKVVPKGLRSFDSQDSDFFVDLLPGPKDRYGIPDSLRFWIGRIIDETDDPMSVGMLFGPSGCGKSSFVKAGLIPLLPNKIRTVYVEATPMQTEDALLKRLAAVAPNAVQEESHLADVLGRVRRGQVISSTRLLIVIDQFEQWLHHNSDMTNQVLVEALRQCDGENLMCLLLVRDDFWMSATQFMEQLDFKVQEGVNAMGIPLFNKRHARKVLKAYGRASEAVDEDLTTEQSRFISDAVEEMSEDGRIIPIHLALFAQMMDSDSWEPAQLKRLGGWQGVGVHFLESIFADKRKTRHENTCRAILRSLLPDSSSDIKGSQKSLAQLAEASELQSNSTALREAIQLLDQEMKIITPTESEEAEGTRQYQLAHDFLVNPVRSWLTQKERTTWQGRARLLLSDLSRQWQVAKDQRFLPGPFSFIPMLFGINRKTCSETERSFLKSAIVYYGIRSAIALMIVVLVVVLSANAIRSANYRIAEDKFELLLAAPPAEVPVRLEVLESSNPRTIDKLLSTQPTNDQRQKLHLLFARAHLGSLEEVPIDDLVAAIEKGDPRECSNIVNALRTVVGTEREKEMFDAIDAAADAAGNDELQIRLQIVLMHLGDSSGAVSILEYESDPGVREKFIDIFPAWHGDIMEVIGLINESNDPAFVTGLCKCIGQLPEHELTEEERSALSLEMNQLFRSASTPGEHSVARWVMQQFGLNIPDSEIVAANESWFIKDFGDGHQMAFLRVEPQIVPVGGGLTDDDIRFIRGGQGNVALDRGFYMASMEVSAGLFYQFHEWEKSKIESEDDEFAKTHEYFEKLPIKQKRYEDLPIYRVTWPEAVRFCNWLSTQDNRSPAYEYNEESKMWELIEGSNGYRMATALEWDAANRAGTSTRYFFGDSKAPLVRYAVTSTDLLPFDRIPVGFRGRKMPNDYGFFDTFGNAYEWCTDFIEETAIPAENRKSARGGSAEASSIYHVSGAFFNEWVHDRVLDNGIRLVLDLEE